MLFGGKKYFQYVCRNKIKIDIPKGYKWNSEAKTLEKLNKAKLKVGLIKNVIILKDLTSQFN